MLAKTSVYILTVQLDNGIVHSSKSLSLEPESCVFHEDDSGRVLHVASDQVRYVVCFVCSMLFGILCCCKRIETENKLLTNCLCMYSTDFVIIVFRPMCSPCIMYQAATFN